ncbi:putative amidoligase domain-containing protein, partial [Herbiconiux daphne]
MTTINIFTTGTDPEMFARRRDNGVITSVAGLLGCSKEKKLDLSDLVRLQEDNVLAEFDINPCENFQQFNDSIQSGIDLTRALLAQHGLDIAEGVSSHIYSQSELESFDKSAFVFGCTPDYNAMTGQKNPSPAAADPGLRTAGGHVHIGFPKDVRMNRELQMDAGVLCDYYLSLPSLFMDSDTRRKELYGKAGAIRFKDYGIEYRSLSNFWIFKEQL